MNKKKIKLNSFLNENYKKKLCQILKNLELNLLNRINQF